MFELVDLAEAMGGAVGPKGCLIVIGVMVGTVLIAAALGFLFPGLDVVARGIGSFIGSLIAVSLISTLLGRAGKK